MVNQQDPEPKPVAKTAGQQLPIASIARVLANENFATAERAALRRMVPGHPLPLAFYGFAVRHLPETWEQSLHDWTAIVTGMAIMAPLIHDPERNLGRVLAETGFSEARLERLLSADKETRRTLFLRTVRFLAAKNRAFNWKDGAQLLLIRDPTKQEWLFRRIAKDFYRTLDQLKKSA